MENLKFPTGPRIYNLFPRLLGCIDNWYPHLDRIKDMEFDWIYLNPVNETGFSGSLYSIKNYFKFNPIFANPQAVDPTSWDDFKKFVQKAHELGLKILYDLVINHTAIDSPLTEEHPDWYVHKYAIIQKATGCAVKFFSLDEPTTIYGQEYTSEHYKIEEVIGNPYAIDPSDARKITIWGDLAQIDNENSPDLEGLTNYWKSLIEFYLGLGIDGFRCDAAYKVPPEMWNPLIEHARSINPNTIFVAETLGCTIPELKRTMEAKFDFINNSAKWWDFTSNWCVQQYNDFRVFAPSIGFPETHDTKRFIVETGGNIEMQIFRYLFACIFSAGVMVPLGYEFGFKKQLDVVDMEPKDMEQKSFDISETIKKINKFKKSIRCLNEDGPIVHYSNYPNGNVLILRKTSNDGKQQILLVYNKNWQVTQNIRLEFMKHYLSLKQSIYQININRDMKPYNLEYFIQNLGPNEYVIFLQE